MEMNCEQLMDRSLRTKIRKLGGLMWWSLVRHKVLLPTFSITQVVLALAIVYGLALLLPNMTYQDSLYLSSGAVAIGIIAVGCVLAAQIIGTAKQDGIIAYQKTLPVDRTSIILADVVIWSLASLPGVIMACFAAVMRFRMHLYISPLSISIILLAQVTMILIGFTLAYWLSANVMALATQVIMIGGLLFSPITYPASRIPAGLASFYNWLPFVPTSNLIRATLFHAGSVSIFNIAILILWALIAFVLSLVALTKRG
jgi:ABC-2 type transport system permease protein